MVIQPPQQRRQFTQTRNRITLEISLYIWAVGATIVTVRTVIMLLGVNDRVWIGRVVIGSTAIVTDIFAKVPGFGHALLGPFSMIDLILIALVILFPLGLLASAPRP